MDDQNAKALVELLSEQPKGRKDGCAIRWHSAQTAPKDGTWFIGVFETGGHLFEPRVGRYRPIYCEEIGVSYDWEVIDRSATDFDADVPVGEIFHHYAEVYEWMPLPVKSHPND